MECCKPLLVVFTIVFGLAYCEVVKPQKCYVAGGKQANCQIHEVKIDPCPEAQDSKPCKVRMGSNSTLTFDYTPTWGATKVGSLAYKIGGLVDIGFEQMDSNGCLYTTCPIEANKRQTYSYSLQVSEQFPAALHQVMWKLWNEDDYHQQCCIKLTLNLVRGQK